MPLCALPNDTSHVSKCVYTLLVYKPTCYCRLKLKVKDAAHLQVQNSTPEDKWIEIIEDLWTHLPHFQEEKRSYDDSSLILSDGEESDSESETWLHQSMDYEYVGVTNTQESNESKLTTNTIIHKQN